MSRFTIETTAGYDQHQLAELNRRYDYAMARLDSKPGATDRLKACLSPGKSVEDHVAAHIEFQYKDEFGIDFDPIREFISAVWSDCRASRGYAPRPGSSLSQRRYARAEDRLGGRQSRKTLNLFQPETGKMRPWT